MSPEFGSTCAMFPIDAETLRYLEFSGRAQPSGSRSSRRTRASRASGTTRTPRSRPTPRRSSSTSGDVVPSLAGPKRPQDRVTLTESKASFRTALQSLLLGAEERDQWTTRPRARGDRGDHVVHEHLEPVGDDRRGPAGEERRRARPRRQAVGQDVARARLEGRDRVLRARRADAVPRASSASTSSATAARPASATRARCRRRSPTIVNAEDLAVVSVLSGNRNFEGRINPDVKMNYLASPPLCVAYALAGTMDIDLLDEPLGQGKDGAGRLSEGHLAVAPRRSRARSRRPCRATCSPPPTARCSRATSAGTRSQVPEGERFAWDEDSTYVRQPPFFDDLSPEPEPVGDIEGATRARAARRLGDHRPHLAGRARSRRTRPPRSYLNEHGVENKDFNSYGSRRGNHEVMMRGTFANIRLRNFDRRPGARRRHHALSRARRCRSTTRR